MQHDRPLTLQLILERMRHVYADSSVVGVRDGQRQTISYGELAERAGRLCSGLERLGVRPGDRVATFAWNSPEHLEAYLAVPCMGAVLHTVNVRLFADQVAYVGNHAEDAVILVDDSLVCVLEPPTTTRSPASAATWIGFVTSRRHFSVGPPGAAAER